jgi:ppGpp synthetase/RelA/SpoT-type nucleotidyltranferase
MVEKMKQSPASNHEVYELLCVSDDQKVINHFVEKDISNQSSKVGYKLSSYHILILFSSRFLTRIVIV